MDPIAVGTLNVVPVFDGTARLSGTMFAAANDEAVDWSPYRDALDGDGKFTIPVGGYVVETGGKTVLLDAGVGDVNNRMFRGGQLIESLADLGFSPADIDIVFCSHLHADHMGWLEQNGTIVFPNAQVCVGARDWEYFVDGQGAGPEHADRMRVVEEHITLLDTDETTIAPGITTRATPGHTPGHTSAVIADSGQRMIMLGDIVHCPTQLTETEWQFLYDVDKTMAARTRAEMLHEAEDGHTMLLPCHFPDMRAARLLAAADGEKRWFY